MSDATSVTYFEPHSPVHLVSGEAAIITGKMPSTAQATFTGQAEAGLFKTERAWVATNPYPAMAWPFPEDVQTLTPFFTNALQTMERDGKLGRCGAAVLLVRSQQLAPGETVFPHVWHVDFHNHETGEYAPNTPSEILAKRGFPEEAQKLVHVTQRLTPIFFNLATHKTAQYVGAPLAAQAGETALTQIVQGRIKPEILNSVAGDIVALSVYNTHISPAGGPDIPAPVERGFASLVCFARK